MATEVKAGKPDIGRYESYVAGQLARTEARIRGFDLTAAVFTFLAGTSAYAVLMILLDRRWEFSLGLRSDLHGTGVRVSSIEHGMVETEFTLVRTGGDQAASEALYRGAKPMTGEDIAATMLWIAQLPPHLNINRLELMPVSQSFAGFQVARAT